MDSASERASAVGVVLLAANLYAIYRLHRIQRVLGAWTEKCEPFTWRPAETRASPRPLHDASRGGSPKWERVGLYF